MSVCLPLVALRVHCRITAWKRAKAGLRGHRQRAVLRTGFTKASGGYVHDNRGDESRGEGTEN
jgi:hypothetical protein